MLREVRAFTRFTALIPLFSFLCSCDQPSGGDQPKLAVKSLEKEDPGMLGGPSHTEYILQIVSHDDRILTVNEIVINGRNGDPDCDFNKSNPARGYWSSTDLPAGLSLGSSIDISSPGCREYANVLVKTDHGDATFDVE